MKKVAKFEVQEMKSNKYECISEYEKKFLISDKYRVCRARGKLAWFHRWTENSFVVQPEPNGDKPCGGQVSCIYGVVEYGDGSIGVIKPPDIKFLDNPNSDMEGTLKKMEGNE